MKKLMLSIIGALLCPNPTKRTFHTLNTFACFLIFFLMSQKADAQCPSGVITLYSQQEVDDFSSTYPGCTELLDDLLVGNNWFNSDISNLDGISHITSIEGTLHIGNNDTLSSLNLPSITSVGELSISDNDILTSLTGLENLTTIQQKLLITKNDTLTDISALSNVNTVYSQIKLSKNKLLSNLNGLHNITSTSYLWIEENPMLTSLDAFQQLTETGAINIQNNDALIDLNGLENITTLQSLSISENDMLVSLDGLNITSVGQSINISDNPLLTDVSALNQINSVGRSIVIRNNDALTELDVFQNEYNLYSLEISNNDNLTHITGFGGLNVVSEDLSINNNHALISLEGLNSLRFVGNVFSINSNDALPDLTGLSALEYVDRELTISGNDGLLNLTGLENLEAVGHTFEVKFNDTLQTLNGLNSLDSIGQNLEIDSNDNLADISSLINLYVIPQRLSIYSNDNLQHLQGLENLVLVGQDLVIGGGMMSNLSALQNLSSVGSSLVIHSTALTDLTGLENLDHIGEELRFWYNNSLSTFQGLQISTIHDLNISYNDGLVNLTGLDYLTSITGELEIRYNDALNSLLDIEHIDLSNLERLNIQSNDDLSTCHAENICNYIDAGGTASIYGNELGSCYNGTAVQEACANLDNLCFSDGITFTTQQEIDDFPTNYPNCTALGSDVIISEANPNTISNLDGLSQITAIYGSLVINENTTLSSIEGLSNLIQVNNEVTISSNANLTNLTGLQNLSLIGGRLTIDNNAALLNLSGLNGLTELNQDLYITNNPSLLSLAGLQSLSNIEYDLYIESNDALSSLVGLNTLSSVNAISIQGNDNLANLAALASISDIDGNLTISDNDNLTSISAFLNIEYIKGNTTITNNAILATLNGLDNITFGWQTELAIYENPNLSVCHVASVCNHLNNHYQYDIHSNAVGCNDDIEIINLCEPVGCPVNPIFNSQQQVNDFTVNHPNCTAISGNVTIETTDTLDPIIDLTPLSQITTIGGDLRIEENELLANLSAFSNLTSIGGILGILNNDMLTNLSGLGSVNSLGSGNVTNYGLSVYGNNSLTSLSGLDNLTSINGGLSIGDNDGLTDLSDLSHITSISGSLSVSNNDNLLSLTGLENITNLRGLFISNNPLLLDFNGLNNVAQIHSFSISENSNRDFTGLESLWRVAGNFTVSYSDSLLTFSGLEGISYIGGNIKIRFNDQLTELTGLNNVGGYNIGYVQIYRNPNLSLCSTAAICSYFESYGSWSGDSVYDNAPGCATISTIREICDTYCYTNFSFTTQQEIDDFPNDYPDCTQIGGSLSIYDSSNTINDLTPLSQLVSVGNVLNITGIDAPDLSGLHNITSVGGHLFIRSNHTLTNLEGLDNLNSIGGILEIHNNHNLSSLIGLENISVLTSNLSLRDNALQTLQGLDNLNSIEGDLEIRENHDLLTLEGLENLNSINGHLNIYDNNAINSLAAFENLTNIGDLTLQNNPSLSVCSVQGICDYLAEDGTAIIQNNASGCNIQIEVQTNCGLTPPPCQAGDIVLITQQQVDNFIIQYPDCTEISGNLTIGDNNTSNDIENLEGLINITSITGNLIIINNPILPELEGLNNLANIGGDIDIRNNDDLFSLDGLESISTLEGNLYLVNNELQVLYGLDNLTTIDGDFVLIDNHDLMGLPGLENLISIGGTFNLTNNDALQSLELLESLSTIGNLIIEGNNPLSICHIQGICDYLSAGGTATIYDNDPGCDTQAEVENNCGITTLPCPEGDLTLMTQQEVDDFAIQYPDCTEITGNLRIGGTTDLPSDINDLSPLSPLNSIQGKLIITKNGVLTNLSGLENLTMIDGDIVISTNPILSDLTDWNNLTSTGGRLIIRNNALSDLTGFNSLTSLGGYINIGPSTTLTSLTGLENLTSINGYLYVHDNILLNNLNGLDNIDYTTITNLRILNNPQLSVCDVPSICNYLENDGAADIDNNASGCNTQTQIENACNTTPPDSPCDGSASSTDSLTHIFDEDLFIDGVGFANNPTVTFTDPGTPANAVLSNISLELYFRLNGSSCENEIALQITDPAGNTQALTAFTTCDGGNGLYYANLNVPSGNTSGNIADWIVEFDDTNDQNSDYEYSVRFARLNYVATTEGSGSPVVNEVIEIADTDLFVDGVGFENNGTYTFADPGTPADAVLSDISLELYFRLNGSSCENEIAIQITDPAGNTQPLTAYTTCDGGNGLYYVNLNVPSGNTTGNVANWVVEFDDTNDQNTGYEYSVRFGRLTYTTTHTGGGGGIPITVNEEITEIADSDLFIDGVGFDNNGTYTFTDPGTPADAVLSNISLELYFRLNGSSCENEIAIQITDPAGNTQPLTAYTTCDGGNGLFYVNLNVPSGNTTGNTADWLVEFDDTNDQNTGYEYSVRFGRLTYDAAYTECSEMLASEENTPERQYSAPTYDNIAIQYDLLDVAIFPNPTEGTFQVKGITQGTYIIHDATGRTIQHGNMENDLFIDISQEMQGMYFISIQMDNEVITKRIVKL